MFPGCLKVNPSPGGATGARPSLSVTAFVEEDEDSICSSCYIFCMEPVWTLESSLSRHHSSSLYFVTFPTITSPSENDLNPRKSSGIDLKAVKNSRYSI